jgi:hypothetical protein
MVGWMMRMHEGVCAVNLLQAKSDMTL